MSRSSIRPNWQPRPGERIDELVRLVFGLLGVAVVIALIGITNTLTLSVLERRREIGLLRAVGLSRRQLRSAISWEAISDRRPWRRPRYGPRSDLRLGGGDRH